MMIQKKLIRRNYSKGRNGVRFIVIHDTANTSRGSGAIAHYNYYNKTNRKVSSHYLVDDSNILQVVEDYNTSWHCGDNQGYGRALNGCTNSNSIGIEICVNSDGNYNSTIKNTAELTRQLMKKYNIPLNRVVRHYDVSRKGCPQSMKSNNWKRWYEFKDSLNTTGKTENNSSTNKPVDESIHKFSSIHKFATEVIQGKYGNGRERKNAIYKTVQSEVNNILNNRSVRNDHVTDVALQVINGQYGNGSIRKDLLYKAIQSEVNQILNK